MQRGTVFGVIIFGALLAFELFNYTTTDFALTDLLGDMRFLGLRWAMILAIAFCGMDFAGIARLFTPERNRGAKLETWYLLAAWFLAATMNATLTWWGVSIALLTHNSLGNEILSRDELIAIVPVFVAVLVWLIRILIIGTFSMAGERLLGLTNSREFASPEPYPVARPAPKPMPQTTAPAPRPVAPQRSAPAQAQFLGADDDDDFDQRPARPTPMEERPTEVRRPPVSSPSPVRPVVSPPIRPAPKPATSFSPPAGNGVARTPTRSSEPPANSERY
jgi:hypothetical protein